MDENSIMSTETREGGVTSSLFDLLWVSVWTGPPAHRLAAKLVDFRASLSLTSSSTRCRSRDASDWDSSSKSPTGFRQTPRVTQPDSHQVQYNEKVCESGILFDESLKEQLRYSYKWHASFCFFKWGPSGLTRRPFCAGAEFPPQAFLFLKCSYYKTNTDQIWLHNFKENTNLSNILHLQIQNLKLKKKLKNSDE